MTLVYHFEPGDNPEAPLFVFVHGRAFDMFAMRIFERSIPSDVGKLYIQAPFADPEGGFCWWNMFSSQNPVEGVDALEEFLLENNQTLQIKPSYTVGYGFSQGAAVLSNFIQKHPDYFAGVALLAGFVLKVEEALPHVQSKAKVLMIHGTLDEKVAIERAKEGSVILKGKGFEVEFLENEVGHKIGVEGMRRLKSWSATF
jgi:predicted esterase